MPLKYLNVFQASLYISIKVEKEERVLDFCFRDEKGLEIKNTSSHFKKFQDELIVAHFSGRVIIFFVLI